MEGSVLAQGHLLTERRVQALLAERCPPASSPSLQSARVFCCSRLPPCPVLHPSCGAAQARLFRPLSPPPCAAAGFCEGAPLRERGGSWPRSDVWGRRAASRTVPWACPLALWDAFPRLQGSSKAPEARASSEPLPAPRPSPCPRCCTRRSWRWMSAWCCIAGSQEWGRPSKVHVPPCWGLGGSRP